MSYVDCCEACDLAEAVTLREATELGNVRPCWATFAMCSECDAARRYIKRSWYGVVWVSGACMDCCWVESFGVERWSGSGRAFLSLSTSHVIELAGQGLAGLARLGMLCSISANVGSSYQVNFCMIEICSKPSYLRSLAGISPLESIRSPRGCTLKPWASILGQTCCERPCGTQMRVM